MTGAIPRRAAAPAQADFVRVELSKKGVGERRGGRRCAGRPGPGPRASRRGRVACPGRAGTSPASAGGW